jgi:tetratricopeptide (TPR) repeat protein
LTADAESHLLDGIEYSRKIDYVSAFLANYWLGLIYLEKKQDRKSGECFAASAAILKQRNIFEYFSHLNEMGLAYLRARQHEKDIDIDRLASYVNGNKIKALEGTMALWMGQIILEAGEPDIEKAENWINRAIEADARNEQTWYLGRDYIGYAAFLKRKKDHARARENIAKAIDIFKECGADGWAEKYGKELAELQ